MIFNGTELAVLGAPRGVLGFAGWLSERGLGGTSGLPELSEVEVSIFSPDVSAAEKLAPGGVADVAAAPTMDPMAPVNPGPATRGETTGVDKGDVGLGFPPGLFSGSVSELGAGAALVGGLPSAPAAMDWWWW